MSKVLGVGVIPSEITDRAAPYVTSAVSGAAVLTARICVKKSLVNGPGRGASLTYQS
jgi:hypothetical protein